MSKITFRADDDLVARIEACEGSKSEVMREALRAYLDDSLARDETEPDAPAATEVSAGTSPLDALVHERVNTLVDRRLDDRLDALLAQHSSQRPHEAQDINVNVTLDGEHASPRPTPAETERTTDGSTDDPSDQHREQCAGCGSSLDASAVYCSNCGEKANHRVFCDCGDELRSDWGFCPGCGRRTPAADVLERS